MQLGHACVGGGDDVTSSCVLTNKSRHSPCPPPKKKTSNKFGHAQRQSKKYLRAVKESANDKERPSNFKAVNKKRVERWLPAAGCAVGPGCCACADWGLLLLVDTLRA